MTHSPWRFWILVFPDVPRPIGGVKQMHRLGEVIQACGHEVVLVQENAEFHPGWFCSELPTIDRKSWFEQSDLLPDRDVLILAETFLPLLSNLRPGLPKIIFNQNGAYSFGVSGKSFPTPADVLDLYGHPDLRQVWCVSEHDRSLLCLGLGLPTERVKLLVNGLEPQVRPAVAKQWQVAYMPRKNSHDAEVVTTLLQQQPWWKGWSLQVIKDCSHAEVIAILQHSLVFVSFGHPEGFGLPVAEAMACGCAVVGYSGLGGRELFDLADGYGLGVSVEPGDWLGFIDGVQRINQRLRIRQDDVSHQLDVMAAVVRQRYSMERMQRSISDAIDSVFAARS